MPASLAALREACAAHAPRRAVVFDLSWLTVALLVASLEVRRDPLTAWEHVLYATLGLLVPLLALRTSLELFDALASPRQRLALAVRHGANRRRGFLLTAALSTARALLLTSLGLGLQWAICRGRNDTLLNRDLVLCCGIGCLATATYMALALAATRVGIGRVGAWLTIGLDLTLGHVAAAWSLVLPHRHVVNLIGHPGIFLVSPRASSWILLGIVLVGSTYTVLKTPR